jgi:hypothetical protein
MITMRMGNPEPPPLPAGVVPTTDVCPPDVVGDADGVLPGLTLAVGVWPGRVTTGTGVGVAPTAVGGAVAPTVGVGPEECDGVGVGPVECDGVGVGLAVGVGVGPLPVMVISPCICRYPWSVQ